MEIINLYYDENLIKKSKNTIWIGIPLEEISMDFFLKGEKVNIYQEVILRLFKCGYNDRKSIEEILKFNEILEYEDNNLIDYILNELETLRYIKDGKITQAGNDVLKDIDIVNKEDKILGNVFYNIISQEYISYIATNMQTLYEVNSLQKKEICIDEIKSEIILGTIGAPLKINIYFLKRRVTSKIDSFTIEDLLKIKNEELRRLSEELEGENINQKKEFLHDLRKFIKKSSKLSYVLVGINSDGNILNSFYPSKNDRSLKIELEKIPKLKSKFKEKVEEKYDIGKGRKNEVKKELGEKEKAIIEESGGKLEGLDKLLSNIVAIYWNENDNIEEKYEKNIPMIYESFVEVFIYLLKKYNKNKTIKKYRNIELSLKNIFKENYPLENDVLYFYISNIKHDMEQFILESEELIKLFIYVIYLENRVGKEKLENYLKNNLNFFYFIQKLINERKKNRHSNEKQENLDEEIDFEFETEAKKNLIEFIEIIFEFKFNTSLNIQIVDENIANNIKRQCEKEIEIEFSGIDNIQLFKKLVNSLECFKYYDNFKNIAYKKDIIMSIGKLLETTLKILRKKIEGRYLNLIALNEEESPIIKLNEVAEKFFSCDTQNSEIDYLFEGIKSKVGVQKKKIKKTASSFKKGTLNTYTLALLYSEKNFLVKNILEKYPEFFKLVFIVSDFRGHSGKKFLEKTDNNIEKDIKNVEKFLKDTFEIVKKILIEIGK